MLKKLVKRGILLILGFAVLAAMVALGWRAWRQHQVSEAMIIRSVNGIDERRFVQIGGVQQWISIRGQNRENPVILVLHGGPGAPTSPLPGHFLPWEREFTVVQWDQRGGGKSYRSDHAAPASNS